MLSNQQATQQPPKPQVFDIVIGPCPHPAPQCMLVLTDFIPVSLPQART